MFYTHLEFELDTPWEPSIDCVDYPENYTEPTYDFNEVSQTDIGLKVQYWYIGIVYSLQILISIIYPVEAALLLYEIVKASRNSNRILSNRNSNEKHRTGKMILVMTIFYVISSAPNGLLNFYTMFFTVDNFSILSVLIGYGSIFMSFLYCVTATSHSLICFGMSSEYRNTVKKLLGIKEAATQNSQSTTHAQLNWGLFFSFLPSIINQLIVKSFPQMSTFESHPGLRNFAESVFTLQFLVAIVGLILNIPHLYILTRPSIRTSSTKILLIGIACSDLLVIIQIIYERTVSFWVLPTGDLCVNRNRYWFVLSLMIGDFLRESFERSSFWIGVFMAFVRVLVMKLDWPSLSKPVVGFLLVIVIVSINSLFSGYFHLINTYIRYDRAWVPKTKCTEFSENYTEPAFTRQYKDDRLVLAFTTIYGASGILIGIIYPILATFLMQEFQKSTKTALQNKVNEKVSMERQRFAKMIMVMTIFYVIASAPRGVMDLTIMFIKIVPGSIIEIVIGYGSIFSLVLFCLNSCTHCVINYAMSSNYRATIRMILWQNRNIRTFPIS